MFNITADNIHVYNLTIRCKALTHDAKHAINGEVEIYTYLIWIYTFIFSINIHQHFIFC
jgi:hypothetical protein